MIPFRQTLLASLAAVAFLLPTGPGAHAQPALPVPPAGAASASALPADAAALPPTAPANAPVVASGNPVTDVMHDARDAYARHDRVRLAALRDTALANRLPLAVWIDYWELDNRIADAGEDEVQAFFARWPGSYLEDRLRNDWLLETGRRHDWVAFAREFPRFRMNDDREVACYALLVDHVAGKEVHDAALAAWLAQKDVDNGCQLMAQTLHDDEVFSDDDVWRRLRQSAELGRARAARGAAQILGKGPLKQVSELWDNPMRFLTRRADNDTTRRADLLSLALARAAAADPGAAALQMGERFQSALGADDTAWTWAVIARQGAQALMPEAVEWSDRAWAAFRPRKGPGDRLDKPDWSDDTFAWQARAALRAGTGAARWRGVMRAVDAMSPTERADPAWTYWRARAELALAKDGPDGDAARASAKATLQALSTSLNFYGLLAAEDLGTVFALPPRPVPLTPQERGAARALPGLQHGLALAAIDLRDEGRREWNYTLRGMGDRELLAAAQLACDAADWQLCINTSERTKVDVDVAQRYPLPYQRDIASAAAGVGLEPAFVFGLIRQETRFMGRLRSSVGANGLMQLMPSTAKWAAKKAGVAFQAEMITDNTTNLRLGSYYLKLVLDSFGGSDPMAAAAYNAGPGRPRRWRGTLMVDPEVWSENVPFLETRDYVKKVMTNAAVYSALLNGRPPLLRPRLGAQIGPRDAERPATPDLP